MARLYFAQPRARVSSRAWYADLLAAAHSGDPAVAETVTRRMMKESVDLWYSVNGRR